MFAIPAKRSRLQYLLVTGPANLRLAVDLSICGGAAAAAVLSEIRFAVALGPGDDCGDLGGQDGPRCSRSAIGHRSRMDEWAIKSAAGRAFY